MIGETMTKDQTRPAGAQVPAPANPHKRRKPLPWCQPKSTQEDPEAFRLVHAIMENPSYRRSDQDLGFLARDELRGIRLQLDYFKTELALEQNAIDHTIVAYGGTRICEPAAAKERVECLRIELARNAGNAELKQQLAIAERVLAKSHYYDVAREFGRLVSEASECPGLGKCTVMTGGGPGIMEAANRGAFDAGAKTVGLNISLPHEQFPNPYVTPGLCLSFRYFSLRKMHFLLRARALVVFPGGFGTFDELFGVLTLIQTRKIGPIPVVLVGESYWRGAVDIDFMVEEGVIDPEDRELFWFAETAQDIWNGIKHWHAVNANADHTKD
jgi:uncharacterized protein (TIGR00730 family)